MTVKNFRKYSKALLNGCFSNHHRKELLYSFSLINKILIFLYRYFFKQNGFHLGHTCSIKKVDKYKLNFQTKCWIAPALKKFILKTNKDPQIKERFKKYKDYKNLLSTILKQSKTNCYNHYFESKWNSIKNTWNLTKKLTNV